MKCEDETGHLLLLDTLIRDLSRYCMRSEIWIGDLDNYRYFLRIEREEYKKVVIYEYGSESTAKYLMYVDFTDERPEQRGMFSSD